MGLAVLLMGLGLVLTGALLVQAGKQRADARGLLVLGRLGLGLGSVAALCGMCWVVVTGV
ncbi:MAG: hypothetical protein JWL70_245 [Acidimicrobiia bacterium]|nr:hypothetical protein [Acidimicrobiia bacterium]